MDNVGDFLQKQYKKIEDLCRGYFTCVYNSMIGT